MLGHPHSTERLDVSKCQQLQQLPPLATLSALQTLHLSGCLLQQLPPLDDLTALGTLELLECRPLQRLPPLDVLKAMQMLELTCCFVLRKLPQLDGITALQGTCSRVSSMGNCLVVLHNICATVLKMMADAASNCSDNRGFFPVLSSSWSKDITGVLSNLQCTCISVNGVRAQKRPA
jgi:hypothetical protein